MVKPFADFLYNEVSLTEMAQQSMSQAEIKCDKCLNKDYSIISVDADSFARDFYGTSGNAFIDPKWVQALSDASSEPVYLKMVSDKGLEVLYAGLAIKGNLLKGTQLYFYSSPEFVCYSIELHKRFFLELKRFAKLNGYSRISMRPWAQQPNVEIDAPGYVRTFTREYEVALLGNNVDSQISGRIMKNIKKGLKAGALVRESIAEKDLDLLWDFIDMTKGRRVSKLGAAYSPFYLFNLTKEAVLKLMKEGVAKLLCADLGGSTYSVLLLLYSRQYCYCILKGSHPDAYKNGLSSFVDYYELRLLAQLGYGWLNLGPELSTPEGKGLNQYKEGLGALGVARYGYYTYFLAFPNHMFNIFFHVGHWLGNRRWIARIAKWLSKLFKDAEN